MTKVLGLERIPRKQPSDPHAPLTSEVVVGQPNVLATVEASGGVMRGTHFATLMSLDTANIEAERYPAHL